MSFFLSWICRSTLISDLSRCASLCCPLGDVWRVLRRNKRSLINPLQSVSARHHFSIKGYPFNGRMKWPTPVCRWWPRTSELHDRHNGGRCGHARLLPPFSCCFALRRAAWFNQATNSIAEPGRNKKRNLLCLICCARRRPSLSEGRPIKCHLFAGNRIVGVDWRRERRN